MHLYQTFGVGPLTSQGLIYQAFSVLPPQYLSEDALFQLLLP